MELWAIALPYLKWVHLLSLLVWAGSVVTIGYLARGPLETSTVVHLRRTLRQLSLPALVLAASAGSALLFLAPGLYFVTTHWMHAKLPLVVVLVGLHHMLGARLRKASASGAAGPALAGWYLPAFLSALAVTTFLAVTRPF